MTSTVTFLSNELLRNLTFTICEEIAVIITVITFKKMPQDYDSKVNVHLDINHGLDR